MIVFRTTPIDSDELVEERLLDLGERRERRELDHRHHRLLEEDGEDDDARRAPPRRARMRS